MLTGQMFKLDRPNPGVSVDNAEIPNNEEENNQKSRKNFEHG